MLAIGVPRVISLRYGNFNTGPGKRVSFELAEDLLGRELEVGMRYQSPAITYSRQEAGCSTTSRRSMAEVGCLARRQHPRKGEEECFRVPFWDHVLYPDGRTHL